MVNWMSVLTGSMVVLFLAACTGSHRLAAPPDYPDLYVSPDDGRTLLFTKPNLDLGGYRKIRLHPTRVETQDDQGMHDATETEAQGLATYADGKFREALTARSFELVEANGDDVLRMQFRILDMKPTSKAQIAMMVPPFAMVNMLSPKGAFTGSVVLAGEFVEGNSTEPSVAFVGYGTRPGVDATVAFRRWDAAKKVIDNAADRLARDLAALQD